MYKTHIKNNEIYLEDVPYSKWTNEEWEKWKSNTEELLQQVGRMYQKLTVIAQKYNSKMNTKHPYS